jgi:hypothetical protein
MRSAWERGRRQGLIEGTIDGSGAPLTGPGNGLCGRFCESCTAATTTKMTNKTIRVMSVPRRTSPRG